MYKQLVCSIEQIECEKRGVRLRTDKGEFETPYATVKWRLAGLIGDRSLAKIKDLNEASEKMTAAAKEKNQELVLLIDKSGKLVNVTSKKHKQIPLPVVYKAVEKELVRVTDKIERQKVGSMTTWDVHQGEWTKGMLVLSPGDNNPVGRSAIYLATAFITTKSISSKPPCLNWSRFWGELSRIANIDVQRLSSPGIFEREIALREVHMDKEVRFVDLPETIDRLVERVKQLDEQVEAAINEPLTRDEMFAILVAYNAVGRMPKYAIELIMQSVEAEHVWGFSQAISWVGTHGEVRGKPGYNSTRDNLARVSAEVLSLAPFIREIHNQHGDITEELLFNPPREIQVEAKLVERKVVKK